MFTTAPGTSYTNNWLADVSEYGTFIVNSSAAWALNYNNYRGESGIPAYTAETEPGVTAYTWNVVRSDYKTKWVSEGESCSADTTLRYESLEEQYSDDGGKTWHSFEPKVYSAKTIAERSIHCGFLSGETDDAYDSVYIDTNVLKNADLTFVNEDGMPNIKTDADGYVTEFTYTDATDDSPVMFNGNTAVDTVYHAFRTNGTNFKIIMKAYCDGNDQVYREGADDNMVNLFTLRGESGGTVTYADGFSFRISKTEKNRMVINGNAQGTSLGNKKVADDGTHLWYWKITYINGVLKIYDLKNNVYIPTDWGGAGKKCDFRLDNGCSAVLGCAVKPDESYYRYCKCKFFEFSLETIYPQYRWITMPIEEEFICDNGDKYYKKYYQVSYDEGETWEIIGTEKGNLYEADSPDCQTDYSDLYFTIESIEDDNSIQIRRNANTGNTEYYSIDDGVTWTQIESGGGLHNIATLDTGEKVLIKSVAGRWANAWNVFNLLSGTKKYKVYGNAMSLLYGDNFRNQKTLSQNFALTGLFFGNSNGYGTTAANTNTTLINAENLVLPATGLTENCYNGMFRNCVELVSGPKELPATTMASGCCSSMFDGCIKLVNPPIISATTLANECFRRMFRMNGDGSSVVINAMTKAPVLYATTLKKQCYQQMFKGCGMLDEVTIYADTDIDKDNALNDWLKNVKASGTIYTKLGVTLNSGSSGLPIGWTQEETLS
jgi:hypothetical protein